MAAELQPWPRNDLKLVRTVTFPFPFPVVAVFVEALPLPLSLISLDTLGRA